MDYIFDAPRQTEVVSMRNKTVVLLGTAFAGPLYELVKMTRDNVNKIFGARGTLVDHFNMVESVDIDVDVYGMKITGNNARLDLNVNVNDGDVIIDGLKLMSVYAADIANNIVIEIEHDKLVVNYPAELGGHTRIYMYDSYPALCLLVRAINKDAADNNGYLYAELNGVPNSATTYGSLIGVNAPVNTMYGGDSGLDWSKGAIWNALNPAYDVLESMPIDVVVPLGVYVDDVHPRYVYGDSVYDTDTYYTEDRDYLQYVVDGVVATYHRPLIDFCKRQLNFGISTHAVIGMNPMSNPEDLQPGDIQAIINASSIEKRVGFNIVDEDRPNEDDGLFLSIVFADMKTESGFIGNAAVVYAMQYANCEEDLSTTNMALNGTIDLTYEFPTEDLTYLALKGVVSYRVSPLSGLVVHNGVSAANVKSEYYQSCNGRMIQLVLSRISQVKEKYIGEPFLWVKNKSTFEKEIANVFTDCVNSNIVTEYDYKIEYNDDLGEITIPLTLKTLYMVNGVNANG